MIGVMEVCRQTSDVPPAPPEDASSTAMTVVVAVEKSLLRSLAFILYQLDRNRARYCASSILQWYLQLQDQLPVAAVNSLEKVADSVVSLSDAQFAAFWRSLVAKELEEASNRKQQYSGDAKPANDANEQEQHVVMRLYQQLSVGIQRLFATESGKEKCRTLTPCTSPVDPMDPSQRQTQHRPRHHRCTDSECESEDSEEEEEEDPTFEPGWAVEYEEQDSHIPSEMSRLMAKMMHSTVPTNLFRATVTSSGLDDDDQDMGCYTGAVTPGSFPPTPITRDLLTRRMNHYTSTVLDHAMLTLRLLSEDY
ncbi:hypothetical protein PHYBOEH_007318 [Phytophthora boehmeriae]|uniref:Uncharacterized protein n=1 Tax=Phytophthora boehmeriae TaxID=109152 RepID=A0A8T1X9P5_9STRA|nr:hypothetical protein PHYBOEH_007318 [Phytophthora boehmeriae]